MEPLPDVAQYSTINGMEDANAARSGMETLSFPFFLPDNRPILLLLFYFFGRYCKCVYFYSKEMKMKIFFIAFL